MCINTSKNMGQGWPVFFYWFCPVKCQTFMIYITVLHLSCYLMKISFNDNIYCHIWQVSLIVNWAICTFSSNLGAVQVEKYQCVYIFRSNGSVEYVHFLQLVIIPGFSSLFSTVRQNLSHMQPPWENRKSSYVHLVSELSWFSRR